MFEEYGSDYKLSKLDLDKLLPAVNRSEVSKSILGTLFERWVTKPEVVGVAGTIGFPLTGVADAILESTTGRQAYQLTPVYHLTYGTEESIFNWSDILRKADHIGVDPLRYSDWGSFDQLNFAPPINLDKFVNFTKFYWANPANVAEVPDYVTITPAALQSNPWSTSNKWYTRAQVESPYAHGLTTNPLETWSGIAKQALYPIIEFDDVELNTWSKISRIWRHRDTLVSAWTTTSSDPSLADIADPLFNSLWELVSETTQPCENQAIDLTNQSPYTTLLTTPTTQVNVPTYLYGQNALTVMIDGTRVYNFVEVENPTSQYSTQIQFTNSVVGQLTVIVGSSTAVDHGRYDVTTTVLPSAAVYTDSMGLRVYGQVSKNLAVYVHTGQHKRSASQQPQFNLYSPATDAHVGTGTIWEYVTDAANGVTRALNKRVWVSNATDDYKFSTDLVDSTNKLNTYKVVATPGSGELYSTIWRGISTYQPRYVNQHRLADGDSGVSVPVGSGMWEPSPLLTANPKRETRTVVRYSEIVPHFSSILSAQPSTTSPIDWSLGGGIKIAHGGEIHFVSSMLAKHVALPNLINFVYDQQFTAHSHIEQQVISHLIKILTSHQVTKRELAGVIYNLIKSQTLDEGSNAVMFHDTQTFNPTTGAGFPNLVPSVAMLGLTQLTTPELVVDHKLGVISLWTHCGGVKLYTRDKQQQRSLNSAIADYSGTTYPTPSHQNQTWYNTSSNELHQLNVQHILPESPAAAADYDIWFDTVSNQYYMYIAAVWTPIPPAAAWTPIITSEVIAEVALQFESDMFKRVSEINPTLIPWQLIPASNATLAAKLSAKDYNSVAKQQSRAPDHNNILTRSYVQSKSFTWYYGNVATTAVNLPHPSLAGVWANSCMEIYTKLYGTPYPHRQPWCIQGYTTKPTWWDTEYSDRTLARIWQPIMWENINRGIVPTGYLLPSQSISTGAIGEVRPCARTSVNTSTSTSSDRFQPDDLLPPYWVPVTAADSLVDGQQLLSNPLVLGSTNQPTTSQYGDSLIGEFIWKQSADFTRSQINSAHSIDPLSLYQIITQINTRLVNGLRVNLDTNNVHSQLNFLQGDELYFDNSVLSLMVLFCRYHNLLSVNDSPLLAWKTWTTKLAYQTGSIIVPQTLRLYEDCVPLENYKVLLKKTENVKTILFSNLLITLSQAGSPLTIPNGVGEDWSYKIDTSESIVETRRMYGSLLREIAWDPTTLTFSCTRNLPWLTGEGITLFDSAGKPHDVYVRNVADISGTSRMQISSSRDQAVELTGSIVEFGNQPFSTIAKTIESTFTTGGTRYPKVWEYITPDRNEIINFEFPVVITGIQNVVNFIHNYTRFMEDDGMVFAYGESPYYDSDTGELVNWHQQVQRFINTVYNSSGLSNRRYLPEPSYATRRAVETPYVELNPFRDRVWINTPEGVVCNVYNSPYTTELQSTACVYDDLGEQISADIVPLRTDRMTTLFFENRVRVGNPVANANKLQHMGSGKVSLDYYEHAIVFDQQLANGLIVYDRFLNIQKPTMRLEFQRSIRHFFRPVLGGFVVTPTETLPNFETVAQYQRHDWNVNNSNELVKSTAATREGLGKMQLNYFQNIPVTSKTEFQFWQKMIRQKGTKEVVDVFTKHKLYDDTEVDEFWAWKLGTFGAPDVRTQVSFDLTSDDLLFDFCNFRFSTGQ